MVFHFQEGKLGRGRLVPEMSLCPGVLSWRTEVPGGDTQPNLYRYCDATGDACGHAALRATEDLRVSQLSQPGTWRMAVPLAQRGVFVCRSVCICVYECSCVNVCMCVSVRACVYTNVFW